MKKQRILSLCLASLMALSLAACQGQAEEQDSTPPTASVQPTPEPTPTPTPPIPYTDVAEGSPYYDAVVWAYENGIASDGSTFEPDSSCTRGQVITFMWRAAGSPEPQTTESPFSDVSSADWFYKPALWAYEKGIATSTTFNPGNPCTNGEALTFLWRAEGKPAAAVYSSPIALAAPDKYFTRPVAWAETNGLFAGAGFDPAAPCSRADLMKYLCWLTEEWAFTEEDKTVQAEYEQIINDAQLFEVHGSGLCYADYVDVDGDGKVELLTVGTSGDKDGHYTYEVTATVYANTHGHAEKICEQTFLWEWQTESLSICKNGNQMCLWNTWEHMGTASYGDIFYKVENGAFTVSESVSVSYASQEYEYNGITETEYEALGQKYTDKKELLSYHRNAGLSVYERGLLPTAEEYWDNYWMSQPMYAAVLRGDFSAFAGNYIDALWGGDIAMYIAMDKNGVLTGDYVTSQKPISITVNENGIIRCLLVSERDEDKRYIEYYEIFPAGLGHEWHYSSIADDTRLDKSRMQLWYTRDYDGGSPSSGVYYKAP